MLAYHELSSSGSRDVYGLPADAFRHHLEVVRRVVGAHECITFDDGHISNHRLALPLLDEFGLRAIFFITTAWTGLLPSVMDWEQLSELVRKGHTIGSHTHTHPFLTACSNRALGNELSVSRRLLEERLKSPVDSISIPAGRVDRRVLAACAEAGYRRVFTSFVGEMRAAENGTPEVVGRYIVTRSTTPALLNAYLAGEAGVMRKLKFVSRAKRMVKAVVGDAFYQKAWRRAFRTEA